MAVDMYNAKVGSPTTVITANLTAGTTTIPVQDIAALTTAPGLATLLDGTGNQEVILYTGISGNDLTGVTRGFEGDARSWATGTFIGRRLTANDINAQKTNIEKLQTDVVVLQTDVNGLQTNKVETATFNNHSARHETGGADAINLAGLLGESAELATHKAENANKAHGGFKGALVRLSANQSLEPSGSRIISWGSVTYDGGGFFNIANPTRLTVPANVSRVRLIFNAHAEIQFDNRCLLELRKNGTSGFNGNPRIDITDTIRALQLISPILSVNDGDYFEATLFHQHTSARSLFASQSTFFALEVVE